MIYHIPSGGNPSWPCYIRYDSPAITQRTVSYDGVNVALQQTFGYSTTWASPIASSTNWVSKQTVVTTYDLVRGNNYQTVYTYSPIAIGASGGLVQYLPAEQSVVYKDFGGNTLKTVTKAWIDPHLLSCELVTLNNGATSGSWYLYGPVGQLPDKGGQIVDKKEYDYNLISPSACVNFASPPSITPTRETATTYQTFANTPIFSSVPSIFDRPSSVITYGAGTRVAEADYAYDQTSVANVPGPPTGHDETNYPSSVTTPRGNITSTTQKCFVGATSCTDAVTKYAYDETGQVLTLIDPCGNTPCNDMAGTNHTTNYSYTDHYSSGTPPGNTNGYLTGITYNLVHRSKHAGDFIHIQYPAAGLRFRGWARSPERDRLRRHRKDNLLLQRCSIQCFGSVSQCYNNQSDKLQSQSREYNCDGRAGTRSSRAAHVRPGRHGLQGDDL